MNLVVSISQIFSPTPLILTSLSYILVISFAAMSNDCFDISFSNVQVNALTAHGILDKA